MTKQRKTFQTTGPVIPSENYFIERREETAKFLSRIERGKYIVIFAPRQTGKTSFFRQSLDKLTEDASYIPIALDFEVYSDVPSERFYQDVQKILSRHLISRLRTLSIKNLAETAHCRQCRQCRQCRHFKAQAIKFKLNRKEEMIRLCKH